MPIDEFGWISSLHLDIPDTLPLLMCAHQRKIETVGIQDFFNVSKGKVLIALLPLCKKPQCSELRNAIGYYIGCIFPFPEQRLEIIGADFILADYVNARERRKKRYEASRCTGQFACISSRSLRVYQRAN